MAVVPRACTAWWPIRKAKDLDVAARGSLCVATSFLDGLQIGALPRMVTLPRVGMLHVKLVEAQSILQQREDVYATLHMARKSLEKRSSTKNKTLMPVWNEDFEFDTNDTHGDMLVLTVRTVSKRYLGHTVIPVSIVALRASAPDADEQATFDFWWPLLDRAANTQMDNMRALGKLHVVLYYNCTPARTRNHEPLTLVAPADRLSSKTKWVKRYLLLHGQTDLPPIVYNFHERQWADAGLLDKATTGVVVAGCTIGNVPVPRSLAVPANRVLAFHAYDGSPHVFVFDDTATRDVWFSTLQQLKTVHANWYDPSLTGVTPTLCEIRPVMRSHAPSKLNSSEATIKRAADNGSSSASLLSNQMDYFIDGSEGGTAAIGPADEVLVQTQSKRFVVPPPSDEDRSLLPASVSYPGLGTTFDIDPLAALEDMSAQEAQLRHYMATSDSDDDAVNEHRFELPASPRGQLAPTMSAPARFEPPPTPTPSPSPSNSPFGSPPGSPPDSPPLDDPLAGIAVVGGFSSAPQKRASLGKRADAAAVVVAATNEQAAVRRRSSSGQKPLVSGTSLDILADIMGNAAAPAATGRVQVENLPLPGLDGRPVRSQSRSVAATRSPSPQPPRSRSASPQPPQPPPANHRKVLRSGTTRQRNIASEAAQAIAQRQRAVTDAPRGRGAAPARGARGGRGGRGGPFARGRGGAGTGATRGPTTAANADAKRRPSVPQVAIALALPSDSDDDEAFPDLPTTPPRSPLSETYGAAPPERNEYIPMPIEQSNPKQAQRAPSDYDVVPPIQRNNSSSTDTDYDTVPLTAAPKHSDALKVPSDNQYQQLPLSPAGTMGGDNNAPPWGGVMHDDLPSTGASGVDRGSGGTYKAVRIQAGNAEESKC